MSDEGQGRLNGRRLQNIEENIRDLRVQVEGIVKDIAAAREDRVQCRAWWDERHRQDRSDRREADMVRAALEAIRLQQAKAPGRIYVAIIVALGTLGSAIISQL